MDRSTSPTLKQPLAVKWPSRAVYSTFSEGHDYEGPKAKAMGLDKGPHKWKKQGLGSNDATIITGLNNYMSPLGLYMQIRGEIARPPAKFLELAEYGNLAEPSMAIRYTRETKRTLIDRAEYRNGGRWDVRRHAELEWMVGALDMEILDPALVEGALPVTGGKGNGALELKSKEAWATFFDEDGDPPTSVQVQFQHLLAVTGMEWGSIGAELGRRFYWVDMLRSDSFIKWLIKQEAEFLERVRNGDPPPADGHPETDKALQSKFPRSEVKSIEISRPLSKDLLAQYDELTATKKKAELALDELKNKVKAEMGKAGEAYTNEMEGDVVEFTWRTSKGKPASYVIKGKKDPAEEKVLEQLGAEYTPAKEHGSRVFNRVTKKRG